MKKSLLTSRHICPDTTITVSVIYLCSLQTCEQIYWNIYQNVIQLISTQLLQTLKISFAGQRAVSIFKSLFHILPICSFICSFV